MSGITIDRKLIKGRKAQVVIRLRNNSGGTVTEGAPVIFDTTVTDAFTTTTVQNDPLICGVCLQTVANQATAEVLQEGFTDLLKVDGTTDIAKGDWLTTFTTAGIAAKRTASTAAGQFALALEAYTTNDGNGVIDAWVFAPNRVAGTTSTWGDDALLNLGADNDIALVHRSTALAADTVLTGVVEGTADTLATAANSLIIGNVTDDGDVHIVVSKAGNTHTALLADGDTGDTILNAATGQSVDLYVAGTKEYDFSATAVDLSGNHLDNAGYLIMNAVTLPASSEVYIGQDNTGDCTVNALSGKTVNLAVAGTDVATFAGAAITLAQATTVSAGGITVTGDSTITGDLTVTGALTYGGNWTVGATLTVDELICDTDGDAANVAATAVGLFRDNAGDGTLNIVAGKTFNISHANTDEYTFSSTVANFLDNALDNVGYVILNAATAPANTEVYLVSDNTGDLTAHAVSGKDINFAIAGADEVRVKANELELVSGTNIQFLGNNAIVDSNGNEVVEVSATASATNGLLIKNAATGDPVIISAQGTGATASRGILLHDSNGNELLHLMSAGSAVNYIELYNSATNLRPRLEAVGGDTNIDLGLFGKGTGAVIIDNGTDPVMLKLMGTAGGYNNEITDLNGNEILALQGVASAVNELGITNAAAAGNPALIAQGGDTNISITITPKAAGQLNVAPGTAGSAAAPDLIIQGDVDSGIFGGTNIVALATAGVEGLRLSAVNNVHIANSTAAATAGTKALYFTNAGTNPSGATSNGGAIYFSGGECFIIDAGGTAAQQTQHDKKGFYFANSYSAVRDKTVRIHLERLVRELISRDPSLGRFIDDLDGNSVLDHPSRGREGVGETCQPPP